MKIFPSKSVVIFFIVGGWNTISGYVIALLLYEYLKFNFNTLNTLLILNILLITYSYINYRVFMYRGRGNWFSAYWKFISVSFMISLFGIVCSWLLIEILSIQFWVTQATLMILSAFISYYGHSKHSFRNL